MGKEPKQFYTCIEISNTNHLRFVVLVAMKSNGGNSNLKSV